MSLPQPFAGLRVLVTGTVAGLSRDGAVDAVTTLGGTPAASVTGKVDLVVAGEGAGVSKMDKARLHGCRVLPGEAFASLVADPTTWDGRTPGGTHAEWETSLVEHEEPTGPPLPRPGDADYIDMRDRHLVGRATDFARVNEAWRSRFRCRCQCGHTWTEPIQYDRWPTCPVKRGDTGEQSVTPPWLRPDGGWAA